MDNEKKSFILYTDNSKIISKLSDEQAGILFKLIFKYADGEQVDADDPIIDIVFTTIQMQMDRDNEKWDKIKEKRSQAGKKGGRPKKDVKETLTKKANAFSEKQTKAKKAVNVNVNGNVSVNENVNVISLEEKNKKFFDSLDFRKETLKKIRNSTEIYESFVDWINYKKIDCGDISKVKATLNMFSAFCTEGFTNSNIIQSTSNAIIEGYPKIMCSQTDKIEKKQTERLRDFL